MKDIILIMFIVVGIEGYFIRHICDLQQVALSMRIEQGSKNDSRENK